MRQYFSADLFLIITGISLCLLVMSLDAKSDDNQAKRLFELSDQLDILEKGSRENVADWQKKVQDIYNELNGFERFFYHPGDQLDLPIKYFSFERRLFGYC